MNVFSYLAIYVTLWWTVLFAVLPIGVTSHHEAGLNLGDGGDPGAPVDPKLKRKFFTTTWVSGVIFAIFWVLFHYHVIRMPWTPT
jgi:predicted secreted protein